MSSEAARPAASDYLNLSPFGTQKRGKLKRLIVTIQLVLKAFRVPRQQSTSTVQNSRSSLVALQLSPSHGLHISRRPPNLQQLVLEDGRQKVNERIQSRLQGQRTLIDESSLSLQKSNSQLIGLSEHVKRILCNSPWNRAVQDIETVRKELLASSVFKDYPSVIQRTLCRVSWYQYVEDGRVIIREGHYTSSFHIILAGKVAVSYEEAEGRQEVLLCAGDTFGEAELLNEEKRQTTCTASDFAELLVISKSDYLDLGLRQARNSYQKSKPYEFCKTVSVLKHWPISELASQPDSVCKLLYCKLNAVVVKNSKNSNSIYVVLSGSCRVVKRYVESNMTSRRYPTHPGAMDGPQSKLSITNSIALARRDILPMRMDSPAQAERTQYKRVMKHAYTSGSLQTLDHQQHPLPIARKNFLVQLQTLQPKEIFGLSTIIHDDEPSVSLVSNGAELVVISKAFIRQHLTESLKLKLKRQVIEYPSEEAMHKRIRDHLNWKQTMTNQVPRKRK